MINLVIFFGSLLIFTAGMYTLGQAILTWLRLPVPEHAVMAAMGTGIATLILGLILLGIVGFYQPAVLWALWAILLFVSVRFLFSKPNYTRALEPFLKGSQEPLPLILRVSSIVILLVCFATVLTPETRHDPFDYHLTIPTLYLAAGKITEIPWHVFTYMPKNTEILYGLALAVGNDSIAKLFHFLFGIYGLILLGLYIFPYLRSVGTWLVVMLVVSMPLYGFLATSAYIDLALAFWQLLALYCLTLPFQTAEPHPHSHRWFWLSALFAGMAMGTKYVAWLIFFPPYAICALIAIWQYRDKRLYYLLMMIPFGLLPVAPWLCCNYIWTQNPVYPLLPGIFGMNIPSAETAYTFFRNHAPPVETFYPANLPPFLWMRFSKLMLDGNTLLFLGLIGIFTSPLWRRIPVESSVDVPHQRVLTFFIVFSGILFLIGTDNHDGRFFFATLALLSIPAAQGLLVLNESVKDASQRGHLILPVIVLGLFLNAVSYRFGQMRDLRETFLPVISEAQRDDWLTNHFSDYPVVRWANENLPRDAFVLGMGYPLQRKHISGNKYGHLPFLEKPMADYKLSKLIAILKNVGITHIVSPNDFFRIPENDPVVGTLLEPLYQYRGMTVYEVK